MGAEYLVVLADLYGLWLQEVLAPGDPTHEPKIEEATRHAQVLGLAGLESQLAWLHLLHLTADAGASDQLVTDELERLTRTFSIDHPAPGVWEVLGATIVNSVGTHRRGVDSSGLERLIASVTDRKAKSLAGSYRDVFLETRQGWVVAPLLA